MKKYHVMGTSGVNEDKSAIFVNATNVEFLISVFCWGYENIQL